MILGWRQSASFGARSRSQTAAAVGSQVFRLPLPAIAFSPARPSSEARRSVRMASATPTPKVPDVYMEQGAGDKELAAMQEEQRKAARPSPAEEARTWLVLQKFGTLSTISTDKDTPGFPATSIIQFAADKSGRPAFAVSTMSFHTSDLAADGRCSLTVASPSFKSMTDGRVTLVGRVRPVPPESEERTALREAFLAKYPDAFWVDFGDFRWFLMDEIKSVRYNGGFGMANGRITGEQYLAASPDPVAAFSAPVCGHMNDDHKDDNIAIASHFLKLSGVTGMRMLDLDKLGVNVEVTRNKSTFKARIPFTTPATDRKALKDVLVEMTKTARSGLGMAKGQ